MHLTNHTAGHSRPGTTHQTTTRQNGFQKALLLSAISRFDRSSLAALSCLLLELRLLRHLLHSSSVLQQWLQRPPRRPLLTLRTAARVIERATTWRVMASYTCVTHPPTIARVHLRPPLIGAYTHTHARRHTRRARMERCNVRIWDLRRGPDFYTSPSPLRTTAKDTSTCINRARSAAHSRHRRRCATSRSRSR